MVIEICVPSRQFFEHTHPKRMVFMSNKTPHPNTLIIPPSTARLAALIALLILAGLAIVLRVSEPEVWGFLGGALALIYQKSR